MRKGVGGEGFGAVHNYFVGLSDVKVLQHRALQL